ncbi:MULTISPECIES: hypothetical protein [Alkalimonas]|uniref:Uncharacterized protein n=1 Tax=Alkalimonas mucilaginosa TaxID=3057676 RepID=A0ABU7JD46_9GAMM|nr:hypothetical protein [Alkalimonas sp. MEB004]MEE2023298.1 hypothetical protein [Alkalimonas sp. MEB004]
MGSFITGAASYFWLFCVISLILAMFLTAGKSSRFTLLIWVIAVLVMDKLAPMILQMSDQYLARNLWYLTWIVIDTIALAVIVITHSSNKWVVEPLTKYIALCMVASASLQAARYFDRIIFQTDLLASIYKYGVPAINIAVVLAVGLWIFSLLSYKIKEAYQC